jgi:predicted nucleic acid-binding protein
MGTTTQEAIIVLDNTVLTNFAMVGKPGFVLDLWPGGVCTTRAVISEYLSGVEAANLPEDAWNDLLVLELTSTEEAIAISLSQRLGAGERSCLAVALNRKMALATDDYAARQYARKAGLVIVGTVGILALAV